MLCAKVMCWGVRNMAKFDLLSVKSPSAEITIGEKTVQSNIIANTDKNPNFDKPLVFLDIVRSSMYNQRCSNELFCGRTVFCLRFF